MEMSDDLVWRESFFKDNFNVDQCLSKYTLKSDLETLHNDLKNYDNELHYQMAEILKSETEAIVNLAEYLTNLNSKIDELSLPVRQLREEIKTLYDLVKSAQDNYYKILGTIINNNTQRNYLNLKCGILSSAMYIDNMIKTYESDLLDDSVVLERAVNKYSLEYNYLKTFGLTSDIQEISFIGRRLTDMVNKIFLQSVTENNKSMILRCLLMYDNLEQQSEAEKTYQVHIVRPALKDLFTETYLETCNQDVNMIYNQILDFIDVNFCTLRNILQKHNELKSFCFILNSIWVEIDKLSREGLPHITAPGNPELFQRRFKSTWNFLIKIAEKCSDESLIYRNKSFQDHIKRFNLPVYFEIRFQQIAGQLENDAILKPGPNIYVEKNEINCTLKITFALWKALKYAFDPQVFIDNLADQFLKISMLLLARYSKWFEVALQECDSFSEGVDAWEIFIMNSINDLDIVNCLIGYNFDDGECVNKSLYSIMPTNIKPIVNKVFQVNTDILSRVSINLQNHLVKIKSNESLIHLQNVTAIPRLYRRTNRNTPKEASQYMVEAIQPVLKFHNKFLTIKKKKELQVILDSVITNITIEYLKSVEEVLRSVCKTEESLRRLKNRSVQFTEAVAEDGENSGTMSDEMKIREQIRLDVRYFIEKLYPVALANARKSMDQLKDKTC